MFERERSSFAETREFVFKHALLRDVAYEGLLRNRRRDYHRRAAGWLEQQSERSQRGDEYAALIAEHLDQAGDPAAARWYLRAGRKARSVHALTEAARLLSRGVRSAQDPAQRFDLLVLHEEVLDRMGDRAGQREALAAMDQAVLDSTAPDGAARAADVGRRITAMLARSRWCFGNSEYEPATRLAAEAAVIASTAQLRSRMAEAHLWTGKAHTWAARPDEARVVLGQALGEGTREGGHRDRRGDAAVPVDSRQQRG